MVRHDLSDAELAEAQDDRSSGLGRPSEGISAMHPQARAMFVSYRDWGLPAQFTASRVTQCG